MRVSIPRQEIAAFCGRWGIVELAIFGSALRDDFRPDSDVDVLVSFQEHARPTLFDMVRMRGELEGIFGRRVDLVSRRGIESSRNQIRKRAILDSAEVVHAA
jgi:predicted nucleotidyltransferase